MLKITLSIYVIVEFDKGYEYKPGTFIQKDYLK